MVKIFLTGATGYIGGSALAAVHKAHPDYEFTLLVRNEERAKPVQAKYPDSKFVYGNLDDAEVLEKAAAEADIVIHTADSSDNVPAAHAISKGLAAGHTPEKPGYWIHLCGTSILTWYDREHKRYGEAPLPEQEYDDIRDIRKLITLPDDAHHRDVDKIVQAASSDAVRLLIVCPPTIYGTGSGPVNTRSVQVPELARCILEKGFGPIPEAGKTEWDNVHIDDLADLFVRFVDATQDPGKNSDREIFGVHGYFFARNGYHKWSDVSQWITEEASRKGYLPEPVMKQVSFKELSLWGNGSVITFVVNSKGVPQRAARYLGWKPTGPPLQDTIAEVVAIEAKALGLTPKEEKA